MGAEETRDRLRVVETLFTDHNWSRINTVHANGRGDVHMAFIKDDIGNWNLKTFSSDPSELLDAYATLAKGLLKKAVGIDPIQELVATEKAIDLAERVATGKVNGGVTPTVDLEALRQVVKSQIERAAKQTQTEQEKEKQQQIEITKNSYKDMRTILFNYDEMLESLQAAAVAGANPTPSPSRSTTP